MTKGKTALCQFRLPTDLHDRMKAAADSQNVSLNRLFCEMCRGLLGGMSNERGLTFRGFRLDFAAPVAQYAEDDVFGSIRVEG